MTERSERLFLYELDLGPPIGCDASVGQPVRLRGFSLAFAGHSEAHGGATATLLGIRGDATVPGVLYEVDAACLDALDRTFGARGYTRTTVHVEPVTDRRSGPTTAAVAYVNTAAAGTPSEAYVAALRAAWQAASLDPAALEHALEGLRRRGAW